MSLQKHHIYQMWENDGTYLGVLQGVQNPFALSQDINTLGCGVITLAVAQNADTPLLPVKAITTEDGKWLTTEDGKGLTTEGEAPNYAVDKSKIRNGNRIRVTEVSDYHPEGLVVFDGVVRKWKINFGTNDDAALYATTRSLDMNGHLMKSGQALVSQQVQSTTTFPVYGNATGKRMVYLYNFYADGMRNISSMVLRIAGQSATPVDVKIGLYNLQSPSLDLGVALNRFDDDRYLLEEATTTVTGTSPLEYTFTFPIPAIVPDPNVALFGLKITAANGSGTGANIYYTTNDVVSGSVWGNNADGSGWTIGLDPTYDYNDDLYFKAYHIPAFTKATVTNFEPSALLQTALANYNSEGGVVTADPGSIVTTGITIPSYTFSVNTVTEGLETILGLSPSNFYYTVDPGSSVLTFKPFNTEADYTLIFRTHINQLNLSASIENVQNNIYFTGGLVSGSNVFKQQENLISQENFGVMIGRINDSKVTNESTAAQLALNYLDRNDDEVYETTVIIPDTTMDITQFKPGQTIGFAGFGTFVDSLVLPIVRIDRVYDQVTLSIGSLPKRQSAAINSVQAQVDSLATVDNPNAPS